MIAARHPVFVWILVNELLLLLENTIRGGIFFAKSVYFRGKENHKLQSGLLLLCKRD